MSTGQNSQYISKQQKQDQKALLAARQAGTIPAEKDEEGKDINPHMPNFITKAPWYLDTNKPSLKHQKWFQQAQKTSMDKWYARGQKGFQATKYRKGACENCGAATHKTKDCCERPRKRGAKLTGEDIQADDILVDLQLDYDSKRDRYNGYNPDTYQQVIDEHDQYEELRKAVKEKEKDDQTEEGDLDYKQSALESNQIQNNSQDVTAAQSSASLRCREDRPVYLENLDVNSAFYDPKSRAMRDNPNPHLPEDQQNFKGTSYISKTGDAKKILEQEVFVWDRVTNNNSVVGSVATPSAAEKQFNNMKQAEIDKKKERIDMLNQKYGGSQHFKTSEEIQALYKQQKDELEEEIDRLEKEKQLEMNLKLKNVDATSQKAVMKVSKYPEDQFSLGHTAIWGSWWNKTLGWGYACCHGTDKQSICEGHRAKKFAVQRELRAQRAAQQKLEEYTKEQRELEQEQDKENQDDKQQNQSKNQFQLPQSKKPASKNEEEQKIDAELLKNSQNQEKNESDSENSDSSSSSSDSDSSSESDDSESSSDSSEDEQSSSESEKEKNKKKKQTNKKKSKESEKEKSRNKKYLKQMDSDMVEQALKKVKKEKGIKDKKNKDKTENKKKRKYNSNYGQEDPSEKEIEDYHRKKKVYGDPMANYDDVD